MWFLCAVNKKRASISTGSNAVDALQIIAWVS